MIKEDYVSFEVAKLLMDKGFDEDCRKRYTTDDPDYLVDLNELVLESWTEDVEFYLAPTLQMAMKWLRKNHRIYIYPIPVAHYTEVWYQIQMCYIKGKNEDWSIPNVPQIRKASYEEACDEALKYLICI